MKVLIVGGSGAQTRRIELAMRLLVENGHEVERVNIEALPPGKYNATFVSIVFDECSHLPSKAFKVLKESRPVKEVRNGPRNRWGSLK